MKTAIVLLLLCCTAITAEEASTKDLEDSEELERGHRKRKRKGQYQGPCGYGSGRTFGEKLFGTQDYTYVSAPVMNYYFGCGVAAVPVAPIAPIGPIGAYPVNIGVSQSQSHHGHGGGFGHGGHHHHGFGHHGGSNYGGPGNFGGPGNYGGAGNYGGPGNYGGYGGGYNTPYNIQQDYQGSYQRPNRPLQGVVSAAASGFGTALADYITSRPRKTYKQVNRQVNQLFKPLYKLF